jgi:hypothetical protein
VVQHIKKLLAGFEEREHILPVPGSWHLVVVSEAGNLHSHGVEKPWLKVPALRARLEAKDGVLRPKPEREFHSDVSIQGPVHSCFMWVCTSHQSSSTWTIA